MSVPVLAVPAAARVASVVPVSASVADHGAAFIGTLRHAFSMVSQSQTDAAAAEHAVVANAPGASMATALVLSDKAEINWNAMVAVRNEVVSAYQSIMNMQI